MQADCPNPVQRAVRVLIATRPASWLLSHMIHHIDAAVFRASGGRATAGALFTGLPLLRMTTTGAKSGQPRAVTLVGVPDGERIILIASNWAQANHPAWYHNVKAHPHVSVERRGRTSHYTARELTGAEREAAWERAAAVYPGYRQYATRAAPRTIPVIALEGGEGTTDYTD